MRLRITFSKTGALRYTGHLDLHKIWERTARRAALPLAYSQGFHPQPKIQLAAALPLGFSGRAELVDIWLNVESADSSLRESEVGLSWPAGQGRLRTPDIQIALQQAAPPGLGIIEVEEVDARAPALQTQVVSAEYEVTLLDPADGSGLTRRLSAVMEAESLPRQRRGKAYDLRPLIELLHLLPCPPVGHSLSPAPLPPCSPAPLLLMRLAAREGATGRPEEVLDTLGIAFENTRIERARLILKSELE
ncbi:MAG: hypothetical protein CO064_01040 [Anaerolineae bacterium CG_4_9_14_0_8_um_filter_58_9]|nr:MAG: hypothetical protein CO064_01040 [Anaerolineae bacterium CG_4_9_14_0_8_um_filter_58_9]